MLQRTIGILLVAAGIVAAAILVLWGADLARAATTGPRWKRRFLTAGLGLLGMATVAHGADKARSKTPPAAATKATTSDRVERVDATFDGLPETEQWNRISKLWATAGEIAAGKKGRYPFNEAGQNRLLNDLKEVEPDIDVLTKSGLLSQPEADLLKKDRDRLVDEVSQFRPTELERATCYLPMSFGPAEASADRLTQRLPLLEKLAKTAILQPLVVEQVLVSIEADLATLADKKAVESLPKPKREQAGQTAAKVREQVDTLRRAIQPPAGELEKTKEWQAIMKAWKAATPLARSGVSSRPQRQAVDKKLEAASTAAAALVTSGRLSQAEANLLQQEAERLKAEVYRNPPDDPPPMPTCYEPAVIIPAHMSYKRLSKQLPLLKKMVAEQKLQPAVVRKILPSIEADLDMLRNKKELHALDGKEKPKAEATRKQTEALVIEIKAALKKQGK